MSRAGKITYTATHTHAHTHTHTDVRTHAYTQHTYYIAAAVTAGKWRGEGGATMLCVT